MATAVTVAIFSLESDLHAHAIADELRRRHGVTCHIVATDRLFDRSGLSWETGLHASFGRICSYDGYWFDIADLDVVWWRRANQPLLVDDVFSDPHVREFVQNEWRAGLLGAITAKFRGRWVNPPTVDALAGNKLFHLAAAAHAGLRTPHTLVSQNPQDVRDFCRRMGGRVAVKKLHGVAGRPLATVIVDDKDLRSDEAIRMCPAIYQELITGNRHVRANCFGDDVHSVLIESTLLDWRRDLSVPFGQHNLDAGTSSSILKVLRSLGLRMGIMDLKIADSGEIVWLELNPQGQFLFCQALSGVDLIAAFALFLVQEAEAASM